MPASIEQSNSFSELYRMSNAPEFSQNKRIEHGRIKKIGLAIKSFVERFYGFFKDLFVSFLNQLESIRCRYTQNKIPATKYHQQNPVDTSVPTLVVGNSLRRAPVLEIHPQHNHTRGVEISQLPPVPPALPPARQGGNASSSVVARAAVRPSGSVGGRVEVAPLPVPGGMIASSNPQVSSDQLLALIDTYRQLGMSQSDIVESLLQDGESEQSISCAFGGVQGVRGASSEPRASDVDEGFSQPANPMLESIVVASPIDADASSGETFVLAPGGLNQYQVGARSSCTLICSRFLELPSAPSTRESLSGLILRHAGSSESFIDAEACIQAYTTLRLAPNPWADPMVPEPTMTVNAGRESTTTLDAVHEIMNCPGIRGALVTGNGITIALKKLDNGKIEIFDPHGDAYLTGASSNAAYVYRCRTKGQAAEFINQKLSNAALSSDRYQGSSYSRIFQFWPIAR